MRALGTPWLGLAVAACTATSAPAVSQQKPNEEDWDRLEGYQHLLTGYERYRLQTDTVVTHDGHPSIHISGPDVQPPPGTAYPAMFRRMLSAAPYRGTRVRISAWIRTASQQPADHFSAWADGTKVLGPEVTLTGTGWNRREIILDVPPNAVWLSYFMTTSGESWMEQWPSVEVVGDEVPITTSNWPPSVSAKTGSAKIVSIECGDSLEVIVHFTVDAPGGILDYGFWTTFGGRNYLPACYASPGLPGRDPDGCQPNETFVSPLPTSIDKVIRFRHTDPDHVDRNHQIGLKVTTLGGETLRTFAGEPNGRCPGHYVPRAPQPCLTCNQLDDGGMLCVDAGAMCP